MGRTSWCISWVHWCIDSDFQKFYMVFKRVMVSFWCLFFFLVYKFNEILH